MARYCCIIGVCDADGVAGVAGIAPFNPRASDKSAFISDVASTALFFTLFVLTQFMRAEAGAVVLVLESIVSSAVG